jgi:hypothetical protein
MEKQLWCVSIKHEDDISETIHHVKAESAEQAKKLAVAHFVENHGPYLGDLELFTEDLDNEDVEMYAFEVKENDIIE